MSVWCYCVCSIRGDRASVGGDINRPDLRDVWGIDLALIFVLVVKKCPVEVQNRTGVIM